MNKRIAALIKRCGVEISRPAYATPMEFLLHIRDHPEELLRLPEQSRPPDGLPPPEPSRRDPLIKLPPGRPSKYSPDLALALIDLIANEGFSRASAARRLGIDPTTLKRWLRRGRADVAAGRSTEMAALVGLVGPGGKRGGVRG